MLKRYNPFKMGGAHERFTMTKQSKNNGGNAPFGFRWNDGELVQEPLEAKIYALIFELFLVHQRKQTVAKLINARGFRTKKGGEFSYTTIKGLLKNPVAKGAQRSSISVEGVDGTKHDEVVEKSVAPIVSEKVWDHVQAILDEQSGKQSRSPTQDIFVGKVSCHCGSPMELPSKSADYKCPSCTETISTKDVWDVVENRLASLTLPTNDLLTKTATTALLEIKTDPKRLLKQVNHDIDKLFSLHASESITDDVFKERHAPLLERKTQLEATLENKKTAVSPTSFIDTWHTLPSEMKRIVVENLIDDIVVSPTKVTVSLYPLFNFAQQVTTTAA